MLSTSGPNISRPESLCVYSQKICNIKQTPTVTYLNIHDVVLLLSLTKRKQFLTSTLYGNLSAVTDQTPG